MRARAFVYALLLLLAACTSTIHYRATGSYVLDPGSETARSCSDSDAGACTGFELAWETERYCGIYKKAPDSLSIKNLRVGTSPTTNEGWKKYEGNTVFQGDDEQYEVVAGEEVLIGSDLLCGQFQPPVNLVTVREGDELRLEIYCRPIMNGIVLMPPSEDGYPLMIEAVQTEKSWLGCRK